LRAVRGNRAMGAGLTALAAVIWGLWSLVLRPAGLPPMQAAFLALLVMASPLPFVVRRAPFEDRGAVAALLLLGVADAGSVGFYFAAIARGPVAVAVLTHYLAPLIVTLVAPLLLGEKRSRRVMVAAPASLLGLALLVWRPGEPVALVTAGLGAASAFFYAAFVFAAGRAGRSFTPQAVTALHALVSAGVVLLLFGGDAIPAAAPGALRVAVGSLLCGLLATSLFFKGVTLVPSAVAGALTYLEPLTAALVGWAVFGEGLSALQLVGGAVVLASGVAVAVEK
jgi:drug/metabolite transporter (DMT)-like permease